MKQSPLHPLLLSAVADSLRRPFPEIRLLPDGAFAARDGRPGTLTGGNLNAWNLSGPGAEHVLDQWRRRETPLAVDYEHQSLNARHNGQPAPAAGWIESLRYEPGQGLFASVRWTEGAKAFIEQDEYRFISPVFSFNPQNGDVLELKGAALTNVPALDGLGAVAATEDFPPSDTPQPETAMNALNRLKQLLGLPEDAAEETLQAELDKLESLLTPANPAAFSPSGRSVARQRPAHAVRLFAGLPSSGGPDLSGTRQHSATRSAFGGAQRHAGGSRGPERRNRRSRRALEPWACRLGHRAGTPEPGGAGNLSCRRFAHCRALVVPEHGQPPRAVGSRRVSALR